ncbi:hypothetical protein EDB87DRAFT_1579781 [Lactarius vividus]|nr:hypothetical protein EDB87DRAFT_1579781 [Lactarius vividus]
MQGSETCTDSYLLAAKNNHFSLRSVIIAAKESVIHDRVNIVRLVQYLVNEANWESGIRETQLDSATVIEALSRNVEKDNEIQPSATFHSYHAPVPRKPDLPAAKHLAHITSGLLTTEDAEASVAAATADVDSLLGSTNESQMAPFCCRIGHRLQPARITQGATRRPNRRCKQEELAAQLAQMAGQLCRNAEHVSGALAVGQGAAHGGREGWRRHGCDAGARTAARSPREGTQNDMSDDIERRRCCDCVFGHHSRGDGRRSLAS